MGTPNKPQTTIRKTGLLLRAALPASCESDTAAELGYSGVTGIPPDRKLGIE